MQRYDGAEEGSIVGGGRFVETEGWGYEIYNFRPHKGYMYGYVETGKKCPESDFGTRSVKLERIAGVNATKVDMVDGVIVVWVARRPPCRGGGQTVVGWYRRSSVFRHCQSPPIDSCRSFKGVNIGYFASAKVKECVLLPPENRRFVVPKGRNGFGQCNVWYAGANPRFKDKVLAYIEETI